MLRRTVIDVSTEAADKSSWQSRLWARVLLSPTSHDLACTKAEGRVLSGSAIVQLWAESNADSYPSEGSRELVVLRLLGARGRAELATQDPADRLAGVSSVTWTLNPPGFGASSRPVSVENYLSGVLAAYDFVADRHRDARVWVYGKSIGATAAMYLAAHRELGALVVKNIIDVPAVAAHRVARWLSARIAVRVSKSVPAGLSPLLLARRARCPALFVVSRQDRLALPGTQEAVAHAYAGSARVLHVQGGHEQAALAPEDQPRYVAALAQLWARPEEPSGARLS
jgi:uncharacterized protein